MGKCPDCGSWDSLEDSLIDKAAGKDPQKGIVQAWAELAEGGADEPSMAVARPIAEVLAQGEGQVTRLGTGIEEFDRVLGTSPSGPGLVPGSAVLIGGEPGIGKSTLMLQAAQGWAARGLRTLYVSSEESAEQVSMRAARLADPALVGNKGEGTSKDLFILADTNLNRIVEQTRRVMPRVLVIDSVQMVYKSDLEASPGSIAQLRRCCAELVYLAKLSGIAVVLVGHVTKDGQLAGPRLLEHLVDCVLYFEGDRYHAHRVVRAIKNRYGTTLEIGLFEMTGAGLKPVPGGVGVLAGSEHPARPGAVVCPVISGTRCYLVEVQALTATGFLGSAKRKSSGLDTNRLAMLIAVLEQHGGLRLADRDVFASAVGGIRVVEPAADLALLLAIAGAHYKRALPAATAAIGEVGLGGEVRAVAQLEPRVREAARLGFKHLIVPPGKGRTGEVSGIELVRAGTVGKAIELLG